MSDHQATVSWQRTTDDFLKGKYSREHTWAFDGGLSVPASASPSVVPAPWSNPANIDPEEAYVASLSSCHMLTFLWLAYKGGFQVDSYRDDATGTIAKSELGAPWVSTVTLRPCVTYSGPRLPSPSDEELLHHQAHQQCFIANSVKTQINIGVRPGIPEGSGGEASNHQ